MCWMSLSDEPAGDTAKARSISGLGSVVAPMVAPADAPAKVRKRLRVILFADIVTPCERRTEQDGWRPFTIYPEGLC